VLDVEVDAPVLGVVVPDAALVGVIDAGDPDVVTVELDPLLLECGPRTHTMITVKMTNPMEAADAMITSRRGRGGRYGVRRLGLIVSGSDRG
jgi:hypothetical protein